MSLHLALLSAISGLNASQAQMGVVSNNVANVNTAGYTRKMVGQEARVIDGDGVGVTVNEITRDIDDYLQKTFRDETSNLHLSKTREEFMGRLDDLFGRPQDKTSIAARIGDVATLIDQLMVPTANPTSQSATVQALSVATRQFNDMAEQIQALRKDADAQISEVVDRINIQLTNLADLNAKIVHMHAGKQSVAELEDKQDQILDTLVESLGVQYVVRPDKSLAVFVGGRTLLDRLPVPLSYIPARTMDASMYYVPTDSSEYIPPGAQNAPAGGIDGIYLDEQTTLNDITSVVSSGRLAALIEMRDQAIPALQSQMDALAVQFRDELNAAHNKGTAYPGISPLTGTRYITGATTFAGASGSFTISLVDRQGEVYRNGTAPVSASFSPGTFADVNAMVTAINGALNIAPGTGVVAAVTNGRLTLTVNPASLGVVAINNDTSDMSGGSSSVDFSTFFGLNDLLTTSTDFANYESRLLSGDTMPVGSTGRLRFSGTFATTFIDYTAATTVAQLVTAINANATLSGAGITARAVAEGSDVRLKIVSADGTLVSLSETVNGGGVSGKIIDDLKLAPVAAGMSKSLSVREDILSDVSHLARGKLALDRVETTTGGAAAAASTFTFTIEGGGPALTFAYAAGATTAQLANAINSDPQLSNAITVNRDSGTGVLTFAARSGAKLTVTDAAGNYTLRPVPRVPAGDNSTTQLMAEVFNKSLAFDRSPGAGYGLPATTATLGQFATTMLSNTANGANADKERTKYLETLNVDLRDKIGSISGVNLDEEMAKIMIFQQSYAASARMISTLKEMFDYLTSAMR